MRPGRLKQTPPRRRTPASAHRDRRPAQDQPAAQRVTSRLTAEERATALLERLITVQEQERRRLALNLHDHLGQQLTALRLSLSSLREQIGAGESDKTFEVVEQIVAQLDRDVDFLAWELRPAALDDVGLDAALGEFLHQWSRSSGVAAEFHHSSKGDGRLPGEVESNLYRITQEALNNVSKHAAATHVSVLLDRRASETVLIVEDNGCGFDVADQSTTREHPRMGLAGIRERAAFIDGECEIESSPGRGTTLFVRVPRSAGDGRQRP